MRPNVITNALPLAPFLLALPHTAQAQTWPDPPPGGGVSAAAPARLPPGVPAPALAQSLPGRNPAAQSPEGHPLTPRSAPVRPQTPHSPMGGASTAHPRPPQAPTPPKAAAKAEYIRARVNPNAVIGGGLIRRRDGSQAISSVGRAYIDTQSPTATAFQLVSLLPGATVATSDPLGFAPQTTISVRGLNGDAIGYVLEGMPLNDVASYGGTPSQFADSENYSEVALQQGSADLDSPVLNAAGALMKLRFREPSRRPGGTISASYGSYDTNRQFLRLETGEILHSGVRGFVSYSHAETHNWRGPGQDFRHHIDFKLLKEWGRGSRVSLLGSWNSTITSYYPKVTRASWKAYGIGGGNNLASRYDPKNAQSGTDYWRLWRDPERTFYIGAPVHLRLTDRLSLDTTPYAQSAYGNYPSGSTLDTSTLHQGTQPVMGPRTLPAAQDGTTIVRADYTQRSDRAGFTTALHAWLGKNDIVLGYWYDYSDDNEKQPFTVVQSGGYAPDIWGAKNSARLRLANGDILYGGSFHTITQVNALYLGDHLSLLHDRLALDLGFKEVMLSRWGTNALPGPQHAVNANSAEPLPRFGLRWSFTPSDQLFLNATTNFRAPAVTAFYNSYDPASGAIIGTGTGKLRNEYSIAEEIGYRHTGSWLTGSVTFFNYNFTNRQVETLVDTRHVILSSTINAGGQTSRGVDIELGTRPWRGFSPYVSFEYLHATIDNDIASGQDRLPTKGKTAVRSPALQASAGLSYDDGHFFGIATLHYTAHQFATFMNDERIPDFITGDLAIGYHLPDVAALHHPSLRLNFINITDQHYLSGVRTPRLNARDTIGRNGTVIAGQPAGFYVGGGFAVLFTASTGF